MNDVLDRLENLLEKEIEQIVNRADMSPIELENAKMAVCLIKEIQEVKMGNAIGEAGEYIGSSYRSYPRYRSYRRGHEPYVNTPHNGGSYEEGYSGHSIKDRMIDRLEQMMDEAQTDHERNTINDAIHQISMGQ